MTKEYGQFCAVAHALDLIGSRWTLLIVRELLIEPKRFSELEQGLPGIPTNVLSARLRELEEHGLVERRISPRPANAVVYDLTDYGRELEGPLLRLGHWGAKTMGPPREGDHVAGSSLALALRAMFHPEASRGMRLSFAVPLGDTEVRGRIEDGVLTVPSADAPPDLTISSDPATMMELFRGHASVPAAVEAQRLAIDGSTADLERFFQIFHID